MINGDHHGAVGNWSSGFKRDGDSGSLEKQLCGRSDHRVAPSLARQRKHKGPYWNCDQNQNRPPPCRVCKFPRQTAYPTGAADNAGERNAGELPPKGAWLTSDHPTLIEKTGFRATYLAARRLRDGLRRRENHVVRRQFA